MDMDELQSALWAGAKAFVVGFTLTSLVLILIRLSQILDILEAGVVS